MSEPTVEEMTDEQIVKFLAVEVMGWSEPEDICGNIVWIDSDEVEHFFDPLTDYPGMLVEKMRLQRMLLVTRVQMPSPIHEAWFYVTGTEAGSHKADTLTRAICIACVKAVLAEKGE